jgi:hypothetical protein
MVRYKDEGNLIIEKKGIPEFCISDECRRNGRKGHHFKEMIL